MSSLGAGGKSKSFLKFRHEVNLTPPFQNIHALLGCYHWVSIEIGGTLLKFSKVFNTLEGSLRPEQPLNVHTPQRRRIQAVTEFLRSDVADQVRPCISVTVHVAVKTGDPSAGTLGTAVVRLVELLLREGRYEKPETLQLFRVENTVEQLEIASQSLQLCPATHLPGQAVWLNRWQGRSQGGSESECRSPGQNG